MRIISINLNNVKGYLQFKIIKTNIFRPREPPLNVNRPWTTMYRYDWLVNYISVSSNYLVFQRQNLDGYASGSDRSISASAPVYLDIIHPQDTSLIPQMTHFSILPWRSLLKEKRNKTKLCRAHGCLYL